jgi:hypothetical protein
VFPSTVEECDRLAEGFENISENEVIVNCVSAVDGYSLVIDTPSAKLAKNVQSYFSGHYQRNVISIQACCDSNCIFTYFGLAMSPWVLHTCTTSVQRNGFMDCLSGNERIHSHVYMLRLFQMLRVWMRDFQLHRKANHGISTRTRVDIHLSKYRWPIAVGFVV